ncbi:MAG: cohesin domain-containing protein, partial [Patescibacteria group bacterium]
MKPVLMAMGALLLVILGYAWMDGKFGVSPTLNRNTREKLIYFEPEGRIEVGEEKSFEIKANFKDGAIGSFDLEFQYDPTVIRVSEVKVNKNKFDQVVLEDIDEDFGKIRIRAESSQLGANLTGGVMDLATIKIRGLKKGGVEISSGEKLEMGVWGDGKIGGGDFQFSS